MRTRVIADGPNITPNRTGLPGIAEAEQIVGALLTFGLIASLAGLVISSIVWAVASHNANPHWASRGKTGVLVACMCAGLVGGADALVQFFWTAGHSL